MPFILFSIFKIKIIYVIISQSTMVIIKLSPLELYDIYSLEMLHIMVMIGCGICRDVMEDFWNFCLIFILCIYLEQK